MSRTQTLMDSVENFLVIHENWSKDENQPVLTDEYQQGLEDLLFTYADGDMPSEMREMDRAVSILQTEWEKYVEYVTKSEPNPRDEFWAAVSRLRGVRDGVVNPPDRPLETVKQLMDQKVAPSQIAEIYAHNGKGPFMRNGIPQPHLVQLEYDKPGSVLGEEFVHPAQAEKLKAAEEAKARWEARRAAKEASKPKPGEETIQELHQQGLTVEQAAAVKCCTSAEIVAEAAKLGLTFPEWTATSRSVYDKAMTEADQRFVEGLEARREAEAAPVEAQPEAQDDEIDEDPEEDDEELIELEIIEAHERGEDSTVIARNLKKAHPGLTVQKVAGVIRSYKNQQQIPSTAE